MLKHGNTCPLRKKEVEDGDWSTCTCENKVPRGPIDQAQIIMANNKGAMGGEPTNEEPLRVIDYLTKPFKDLVTYKDFSTEAFSKVMVLSQLTSEELKEMEWING